MEYMKAVNFTGLNYSREGEEKSKESLRSMMEETSCNTVMIVLGALQESAHSEEIDYRHASMPPDRELKDFIYYAKALGLRVVLKPFVNCKDGTWRAYISFFEHDIICEPKWSVWFQNYKKYQLHYAAIAEETGCEMLVAGSEMIMSERREEEWRDIFTSLRQVYGGCLCYNTDKYQEEYVGFWDELDVISSSGFYPADGLSQELDRIERVAARFRKPFIFSEFGCKSSRGASKAPNEWGKQSEVALEEQAEYYRRFFDACRNREYIKGLGIWDWHNRLYAEERGRYDNGFSIYGKPVCTVIRREWGGEDYNGAKEGLWASNIA